MKRFIVILITAICVSLPAFAEYNNKIHVYMPQAVDGDTMKIRLQEGSFMVRFTGIDCFESTMNDRVYYQMRKNYLTKPEILEKGQKAKTILNDIITKNNTNIWLQITGLDKTYGRLVGVAYYQDKNGNFININDKMKASGYCPEFIFRKK